MSPWTALLESLHSSLIDELNARLPDSKPGLGLPIRKNQWLLPTSAATQILVIEIEQKEGIPAAPGTPAAGFACLAVDPECEKLLGGTTQQLWDALLKRAGTEFHRRGIKPQVSRALLTPQKDKLPDSLAKRAQEPSRVIWIPLTVGGGQILLGMGI